MIVIEIIATRKTIPLICAFGLPVASNYAFRFLLLAAARLKFSSGGARLFLAISLYWIKQKFMRDREDLHWESLADFLRFEPHPRRVSCPELPRDASRAPSAIAASLAHTTSGSTAACPTQVP